MAGRQLRDSGGNRTRRNGRDLSRARQRHSRRIVALKRIVSYHADSRETLERFRREAEAAASLDHPNILPIYEVGQGEDGLPFFSMKYAAGGSLQKPGRRCAVNRAERQHKKKRKSMCFVQLRIAISWSLQRIFLCCVSVGARIVARARVGILYSPDVAALR